MDFGSHLFSGIALALCLPDDPDPVRDKINKGLVIAGSVLADLPVSLIWRRIGKTVKKSVARLELTEHDWSGYAPTFKGLYGIYNFLHGLPFLILVAVAEIIIYRNLLFSRGLLVHQAYDLFTHKYENSQANPKPFYPIWGNAFTGGVTNNFTWAWYHFGLSWLIHLLIIAGILFYKYPQLF